MRVNLFMNRMRMQALSATICLLLSLSFLPSSARAGAEGHGGQSISVEGQEWLRDLVDNSSCTWFSGDRFAEKMIPEFAEVLRHLEQTDEFYAENLKADLAGLQICLNDADLRPIPEVDGEIFVPYVLPGQKNQIAVRVHLRDQQNDTVFVDRKLFLKMPPEHKPYLLLHESTHGLIPLDTPLRNLKVRSFVKTIAENQTWPMDPRDWMTLRQASSIRLSSRAAPILDNESLLYGALYPETLNVLLAVINSVDLSALATKGFKMESSMQVPHPAGCMGACGFVVSSSNLGVMALVKLTTLSYDFYDPNPVNGHSEQQGSIDAIVNRGGFDSNHKFKIAMPYSPAHYYTVLNYALFYGYPNIAKALLLKTNADPFITDAFGQNAWGIAMDQGYKEIVDMIESKWPEKFPPRSFPVGKSKESGGRK